MKKGRKGFTLIELAIVMLIIGILSAIIMPKFVGNLDQSKIGTTKANLEILRSATKLYYVDNQMVWPPNSAALVSAGNIKKIPEEEISATPTNAVVAVNDGTGGWVYKAASGEWYVNLSGNDANGDAYADY